MRTWAFDEGVIQIDGQDAVWLMEWIDPFDQQADELAQFIVDACNAAEEEAADVEHFGRAGYYMASLRSAEFMPGEAQHLISLINERARLVVSPRGHAVMEDMATYEAMHPVHNPIESPP